MFRWNFLRDIGNKVKESLLFTYAFEQKNRFFSTIYVELSK